MQTKLTLRMDGSLIEKAKRLASEQQRSVSQLVADYFACLEPSSDSTEPRDTREVPEVVARLHGALRGAQLDEADYRDYLERKHQ